MDQIKAFISHSSDDALYVDVLINLIGKNGSVSKSVSGEVPSDSSDMQI